MMDAPQAAAATDWLIEAACRKVGDTSVFYVDIGNDYAAGRAVCRACPVQTDCLEYALDTRQLDGLWGNTSPKERRAILNGRTQVARCESCTNTFPTSAPHARYCSPECQKAAKNLRGRRSRAGGERIA